MKNIEFITRNPHLINAAPIIPMKNYKPNWYKNLDINSLKNEATTTIV